MRSDGLPCAACREPDCLPCPEMEPPPAGLGARLAARLRDMRVEARLAYFAWTEMLETDPYSQDAEDSWHLVVELRARHEGAREIAKIILKGE